MKLMPIKIRNAYFKVDPDFILINPSIDPDLDILSQNLEYLKYYSVTRSSIYMYSKLHYSRVGKSHGSCSFTSLHITSINAGVLLKSRSGHGNLEPWVVRVVHAHIHFTFASFDKM